MTDKKFDPSTAIYTPAQSSTYALQYVQKIQQNKTRAVPLFIPTVDDYYAPLMPGQITTIIGQTSHYKSGLIHHIEFKLAKKLANEERDDEIIVHVSTEESVEEQAFEQLSRFTEEDAGKLAQGKISNRDDLERAGLTIGNLPIYRIGYSMTRADVVPEMYFTNMIRAIRHLQTGFLDWRPKIAGIFFDYLQAFGLDPEKAKSRGLDSRRLQVRDDLYGLREVAVMFDCPVYVAVQAKQNLRSDKSQVRLPNEYDAEESSAIAQRSDRIVSLWMPERTYTLGDKFEFGSKEVTVETGQLWIKINKQRGGYRAGQVFPCKINWKTLEIDIDHDLFLPRRNRR